MVIGEGCLANGNKVERFYVYTTMLATQFTYEGEDLLLGWVVYDENALIVAELLAEEFFYPENEGKYYAFPIFKETDNP